MPQDLFISYSRSDMQQARTIHDGLEEAALNAWWDQENVRGEDYARRLTRWIRAAEGVILLLSQRSVGSVWVKREVLLADAYRRRIIPVYLESKQTLLDVEENSVLILVIDLDRISAYDGRDPLPEILNSLGVLVPDPARATNGNPGSAPKASHQQAVATERPAGANVRLEAIVVQREKAPRLSDRVRRILMTGANESAPLLPPASGSRRARLTFVINGSLAEFPPELQAAFVDAVTMLADLAPDDVALIRVREGSVKLTLELPASTAGWLVTLQERRAPLIGFLGATAVEELEILPEPGLLARLREWLGALSVPQRLVGAGALSMLVLALVLFPFLNWGGPNPTMIALCGDLTLASGTCPGGGETAFFEGEIPGNTLSGPEEAVPRLIAPRGGRLLETATNVNWTAATGATSYEVVLSREGAIVWSSTVTGTTTLDYPPTGAPPLERGATYRFTISSNDGRSENLQGIGFTVLSEEEAVPIRAEEQAIRAQGLDATTTATLVANLYANSQLYGEALGLLDPIAETAMQPAVELLRGNIYLTINLPELALASYERALTLAQAAGDELTAQLIQAQIDAVREKLGT